MKFKSKTKAWAEAGDIHEAIALNQHLATAYADQLEVRLDITEQPAEAQCKFEAGVMPITQP